MKKNCNNCKHLTYEEEHDSDGHLRVVSYSNNDKYILSDYSWNKQNPDKFENIEEVMEFDIKTVELSESK